MSEISRILTQIECGDPAAADKLLPLVYDELRKLAAAKLVHEMPGQTLQATALVHEAYLRLVGPACRAGPDAPTDRDAGASDDSRSRPRAHGSTAISRVPGRGTYFHSRNHFFAAAAEAMRRILVEQARRKARIKHGGQRRRVELPEELAGAAVERPEELLAVHEALDELARVDEPAAQLVKLHYFAGLDIEEAAAVLGIAPRTAYRNWSFARAWLFRHLQPTG